MAKVDLNLLRVLLAVHETGTVTAAADKLGVSQPAASAAIARLRKSLDDALFVWTGSTMQATPRALAIIDHAREVITTIDEVIMPSPVFDPSGHDICFNLCLSEIGEMLFLPSLMERLSKDAPHARVTVVSRSPRELLEGLADGSIDSALGFFPDLNTAHIYQQRLFSHDLACLVRKHHPARGKRISLDAFVKLEHLHVRDGSRSQEMYEAYLAQHGIKRNIVLQTSHYASTPTIIEHTDLIVVLPRFLADYYIGRGAAVRILETPVRIPRYDLKHHWHARFQKDPRHQWLRRLVWDVFQESPELV